jgi:nitrate reductase gamma subunit
MNAVLDFARGPMFRFTFAVMILGLLRILILDVLAAIEAYRRAGDKKIPWKLVLRRSLEWFIPVNRVFHNRPVYSLFSVLFHVGLILAPIFLYAHIQLLAGGIGISWTALPEIAVDVLTVSTVVFALLLFVGRVSKRTSSFLSRRQDYFWPLLLSIPFITGFVCANLGVGPTTYRIFMLIHVLSAELIFVLIPFTKIAHCVLMPLSQLICTLGWKFPPETDDKICTTLGKKGAPV